MFQRWIRLPSARSLLLLGPRRAGKSTLLRAAFPSHQYASMDDLDSLAWARFDPKGFVDSLGARFVIDEAQRAPEIAVACKWAIDEKRAHVVLTGSTGLSLFQATTETLAGRIDVRELPPSCFGEAAGPRTRFSSFAPPDRLAAKREWETFVQFGGFPEVAANGSVREKADILRVYKNSYFTRDLADLSSIENVEALRAMYQTLIRGLGSRGEISSLARECGLSVPSAKKYLNSLLQAGLAFKLYGFHLGPAKRYVAAAKTYFCDNGVIQSLSDAASDGQIVENFVISEIEKRRKLGFIKADQLFYYESTGGREIDLIVEEPHQVTAIEVKSSARPGGRDLRALREFVLPSSKKRLKKILFYGGDEVAQEGDIELRPIWTLWRW